MSRIEARGVPEQPAASGVWRRRTGVAVASVLVALVAAEVGLRVVGYEAAPGPLRYHFTNRIRCATSEHGTRMRRSASVFWEPRPGAPAIEDEVPYNSLGLRGPEYPIEAPERSFRIAVMGDSCTYGANLAYADTYGARLERALRSAHSSVEVQVFNAGVPGYSVYQGWRTFEEKVRQLRPDLVVLYYGAWNDFNPAMGASDVELGRRGGERAGSALDGLWSGLQASRLCSAVLARYAGTLRHRNWRKTVNAWLVGEPEGGYRVPIEGFSELFGRLLDECEGIGARVLVVVPELNHERRREHALNLVRLDRYRQVILEASKRCAAPTVDLRELFSGAPHSTYFSDLVHPNVLGHQVLADALLVKIEARDWVGTEH